jgi:superfamily I DNA and RNA helicase
LKSPDFFTRSLRATIKTLVTRFYRLYSDSDPDWKRLHIRHGWGGSTIPGVYSDACARSGKTPLRLAEANRLAGRGETAFGAACSDLMKSGLVRPFYDHVLIDEGQDFPAASMGLPSNSQKESATRSQLSGPTTSFRI